ncbi:MAG: PTS ascorbate transporter subunit IIC [Oscillospiraceae bacterium]|nr:PTS ascorbate transporter subunit IIC [Oscillospiraceae bacterium]
MVVLDFIINEIFGQGAIFLALIALVGLLLQRKSFTEIVRGTLMTAIGFFVLMQGVGIIAGESISGIAGAFSAVMPDAGEIVDIDMGQYGTQIGIVMVIAFAINLIFARLTRWKSVFLTGHMLYWFPFIFIAAGISAGLSGVTLVVMATIFTALYMIVSPNIIRPLVREVTGDDSFTLGHPTTVLSLIAGYLGKVVGNKEKSTEDLKLSKSFGFLREVSITGSIVIALTYIVMMFVMMANGLVPAEVWGVEGSMFTFIFIRAIMFGVGVTVMLLGVRMLISEIVPAFQGIAQKLIPGAIPALDCPMLFPYAPNALIIGFIVGMIASTITILLTAGMGIFPIIVIPLVFTCFFEIGTAAIIGNGTGGMRGCIIGAAVAGVVMVFLVGFGAFFFEGTINGWMLVFGGNDFSLWGSIMGLVSRIFA